MAISPVGAQPATTSHAGASAVRHVTLLVTDAATGLPLDAVRASLDGATVSPALGDGRGHVTVAVTPVRHDAAVVVRRLGYAPRTVSLDAIAAHAAMHPGAPFPIALDARPALLNTVSVEEARPNQLAAGTALAVGTVDGAAVAEAGATSLAEALDALEGVTVGRVGAWGSKASIRGLGGERLAVMIDGARVGRACAFGMDQGLATLDPAVVERVELLAGPGSTLYGSGNIGGVLNVVTRNPALAAPDGRVGGELRLGASTAVPGGTLGGGVWTRRGRLDVALQLDAQRYGDYRTPTAAVAGSSFRAATGDLKVGWALTGAQRIALQLTDYQARDIGWPTMTGGSIPKEGRRAAALDWGWQRGHGLVDAASASVFAQRLDHHMLMDMVMPMSMGGMGSMGGTSGTGGMGGIGGGTSSAATMRSTTDARSHSTTSGARAQLRLRPGARTHVDAGVEATQWAAEGTRWSTTTTTGSHGGGSGAGGMGGMSETSGMSMPTASKTTATHTWPGVRILDLGLFAQGEHQATDRLTLSGGARVDRIAKRATGWVSDVQTLGTGNLGARLALGGGLAARASAGMGYRTPDPTELFGVVARPDGFVYRGNPALDTETGRTVEAGLAWDGAWHALAVHEASASVTAFRNDLRGLIAPALAARDSVGGRPVREYVNVSRARIAGVTAAARADVSPAVRLTATATVTRGEDLATGAPLAAVAPATGALTARFAPNAAAGALPAIARAGGWLELEGRAATRQGRALTSAGEVATPGWGALALRGGARVAGTALTVGVDNLLDRTFREHLDPTTLARPGRNVYLRASRVF